MDWYPFYPDLYASDTMHLDPYQDGCYRRLIDHYMRSRYPLPDNDAALARIVGDSVANWVAMASAIVRPFFTPKDGLLHLKRCDDILDDQDSRSRRLSEHGKRGAEKRWKSKNNSHPIATPMGSAIAQDKTRQDKEPLIVPLKGDVDIPVWLSKETWESYRKHRGKKFTDNAQRLALKKLTSWKADGHDPNEILNNSIMNGWKGLFEPTAKQEFKKYGAQPIKLETNGLKKLMHFDGDMVSYKAYLKENGF